MNRRLLGELDIWMDMNDKWIFRWRDGQIRKRDRWKDR